MIWFTISSMKRLVTGIQPTGKPTLGHLFGTANQWETYQKDHQCFFFIADLHAITLKQDPAALRQRTIELFAFFLACGVDTKKSHVFVQSQVPQHCELSWLLSCSTHIGELSRMTQFKDKSSGMGQAEPFGLFAYPVLMAADILLYQADVVPVGEDQKQHLELTRNLVNRFNHHYGEVLTMPEPLILSQGARIMSLQDPLKKMSKSDPNHQSFIAIDDEPKAIEKKIKKAVTDSLGQVAYDEDRPGISNLVEMYAILTGLSYEAIAKAYEGKGYGHFKQDLAEQLIAKLVPIQNAMAEYLSDPAQLEAKLTQQTARVIEEASDYLRKIKSAIGLI